jgi:hypothetical protein
MTRLKCERARARVCVCVCVARARCVWCARARYVKYVVEIVLKALLMNHLKWQMSKHVTIGWCFTVK